MAGTFSGFDAAQFRESIKFAMNMGTPANPALAPTFIFPPGPATYEKNNVPVIDPPLDRDGYPFDPEVKKVQDPGAQVRVDCAIEISKAEQDEIPAGNFRPVKATITVLDVDYALIEGAREVLLGGDRFVYGYELPPMGMFEVTIHQLVFYAVQES